jgi:hypothetical protein
VNSPKTAYVLVSRKTCPVLAFTLCIMRLVRPDCSQMGNPRIDQCLNPYAALALPLVSIMKTLDV